ncbi:lipocalin-like protein [Flavobacterium sp. 270]|uniref:lipocalin family protein n=1 Tax=Flavobacterium sp. 270 TaxID=2512114 RepID=UPI001064B7C3|nr:lipocalin family protein [Flavobacterium sp. 270]TDW49626.1 lipocalin-like protein [Flavobacterium sp. 270]
MKNLKVLFLSVVALALSVSSCSNDNNNEDTNTNGSLIGKWELSQVGTILGNEEVLQPYTNDGCDKDVVEFTTDGKFIDRYSEFTNNACKAYTQEGTWTKDENTLSKKYASNDSEKFEITELSGSKLKVKETYSQAGITVIAISVYKKI